MLCRMSSNYGAKSTAIIFGILMITMITAPIWGGVGTHDIPALMLVLVTGLVCPILLGGYAWLRWPAVKKLKQFVPIELRSAWVRLIAAYVVLGMFQVSAALMLARHCR
jgi:hypothetical protein